MGWVFILPWFIGLLLFFIQPIFSLIHFSFTTFTLDEGGYSLKSLGGDLLANYREALFADANFPIKFVGSFTDLLYQTPIIVFFSLFSATLLNKNFRGRTVVRAIFFLPIIVSAGVVSSIIQADVSQIPTATTDGSSNIFDVSMLVNYLLQSGIPQQIVNIVSAVVADVAGLVWNSTVQILIFLIALLSIPKAYYEVADVEGATGWETFWKVTFPMISPFVLANTVYTIIDSFTNYSNLVIRYIMDFSVRDLKYSYSAAMAWIYFLVVSLLIALVFLLFRKIIFYGNSSPASGKGR